MTAKWAEQHQFTVAEGGARLDLYLSERLELTRSQVKRLVDQELVQVNGEPVKAGYKLKPEDRISVFLPESSELSLEPEPIPLEIVYEDEELAVINKPRGLVVHPGAGNPDGTLVNALLFHLDELSEVGDPERPGIVHRLDKDTSGLLVVAKTDSCHTYLTQQIKERLVARHYLALVQGVLRDDRGTIEAPIGRHPKDRKKMAVVEDGRPAVTHFEVLERFARHSLVRCRLVTGRTHQIRVHLAHVHHPLVGDPLYGYRTNNLGAEGQMLHAAYLAFTHPQGQFLEFSAEPDAKFWGIVEKARRMS